MSAVEVSGESFNLEYQTSVIKTNKIKTPVKTATQLCKNLQKEMKKATMMMMKGDLFATHVVHYVKPS